MPFFSVIVPVYNRPVEVDELLNSLTMQSDKDFEIIIVEDGSSQKCDYIANKYSNRLDINYLYKDNSGPADSRNFGATSANGTFLVFFDSDCIIPKNYFKEVKTFLSDNKINAYGGPDRAHDSFTVMQKAINYSMTSFFTTGGIRGQKKSLDKFHPRSFNLGVTAEAFNAIGGYGKMRFGEDIDFSLRLIESGFSTALIPNAYVYHKRRNNFKQFFKQVHNSGIARINLHLLHPKSLKLVHLLPAVFTVCMFLSVVLSIFYYPIISIPIFYSMVVFGDALRLNKSAKVALFSVGAAWTQLIGYGTGFLLSAWKRLVLKQSSFNAFEKNFYK